MIKFFRNIRDNRMELNQGIHATAFQSFLSVNSGTNTISIQ